MEIDKKGLDHDNNQEAQDFEIRVHLKVFLAKLSQFM